ncbi:MAG: FliM/FliN family flagellar motor switch protein [Parvularculaceae bacterium]|nr:FliM/FliN family flagellar motor switch protein [Parvularculaceae bacterium]
MAPPADAESRDEVIWDDGSAVRDLLGFDLGAMGADRSGLNALVNSALVAHRRLPMLDVVFDRAARRFATTLRQLANDNADVALDNVTSARFGDFLQAQSPYGVVAVLRSAPLNGALLIAADPAFIHQAVDLLLGGRRGATRDEERPLTAIESAVMQRLIEGLVSDCNEAFKSVDDIALSLERLEAAPRFAAIAQETSVCAIAKYRVTLGERQSRLMIVAPYASLEAIEPKLERSFSTDADAEPPAWRQNLNAGVSAAALDIAAVLADRTMRLGEVRRLAVGDVIAFGLAHDPRVELRVGDAAIAAGRVGKQGQAIAVRLDTGVDRRAAQLAAEKAA